jgi:hypothetical protein
VGVEEPWLGSPARRSSRCFCWRDHAGASPWLWLAQNSSPCFALRSLGIETGNPPFRHSVTFDWINGRVVKR